MNANTACRECGNPAANSKPLCDYCQNRVDRDLWTPSRGGGQVAKPTTDLEFQFRVLSRELEVQRAAQRLRDKRDRILLVAHGLHDEPKGENRHDGAGRNDRAPRAG